MTETSGPALLAIWLKIKGLKKLWLAEKVATSPKTLGWWLAGKAVPSQAQANHIETLTNGSVPASTWWSVE